MHEHTRVCIYVCTVSPRAYDATPCGGFAATPSGARCAVGATVRQIASNSIVRAARRHTEFQSMLAVGGRFGICVCGYVSRCWRDGRALPRQHHQRSQRMPSASLLQPTSRQWAATHMQLLRARGSDWGAALDYFGWFICWGLGFFA